MKTSQLAKLYAKALPRATINEAAVLRTAAFQIAAAEAALVGESALLKGRKPSAKFLEGVSIQLAIGEAALVAEASALRGKPLRK